MDKVKAIMDIVDKELDLTGTQHNLLWEILTEQFETEKQIAKRIIEEYFNQDIEFLTTYDYLRKRILNWLDKEGE